MDTENLHIIDEIYGFKSLCHIQTREGIVFSANQNNYILKPVSDSAERCFFTYAVHNHLNQNGFPNTDRIIKKSDGGILSEIHGKMYVCHHFIRARQCAIENAHDCKHAALLLASMHNSGKGFTPALAETIIDEVSSHDGVIGYVRNDLGNLPVLFAHRTNELMRFKKQALRYAGKFDYEYISIADHYHNIAENMCAALDESQYSQLSALCNEQGNICHRDYTSHNILFSSERIGITGSSVVNFSCSTIDLPIFDLANLIKRRMRKCGWNSGDAHIIMNEYSRLRPLTKGEVEIIKIALSFPQKLWRVVNIYYNSRRSWCEKSCLIKLEEIKKEQEEIDNFIKTF